MKKVLPFAIGACLAMSVGAGAAFAAGTGDGGEGLAAASQDRVALEKDDFETNAEYERYLQENPWARPEPSRTAKASPSGTITMTREYTLTGVDETYGIQKTFVGSTYIYALQYRGLPEGQDENANSKILRFRINDDGETASYLDCMYLDGFAHDQSLEYYYSNGHAWFWTTCAPTREYGESKNKTRWSIHATRFCYAAGTTVDYSDYTRLRNFGHASPNPGGFGTIKRVECALSDDMTKAFFWARSADQPKSGAGCYSASALAGALGSAAAGSTVDMGSQAAISRSGDLIGQALPNRSVQGVEVGNSKWVFVLGGLKYEEPVVACYKPGTPDASTHEVSYTLKKAMKLKAADFGKVHEPEGIQLAGGKVYVGIFSGRHNDFRIYSFSKSSLTS